MSRLVIKDVTYFDVTNKKLVDGHTIVIEKNKFNRILKKNEFSPKEDDIIINGNGKYLFPGLIDCHVHLSFEQEIVTQPYESFFRTKDGEKLLSALRYSQKYLVSGFTTLRDCGSRWKYMMPALRDSIANGTFYGPRLLVADVAIAQPGNQEMFGPEYLMDPMVKEYYVGSGKDNILDAVRERKRRGANFIKTATTGGVLHGKGSKVDLSLWTPEELEAMVQEAKRLGMHVAAHAHFAHGILKAVQAGVHTIEHGTILTEEIVDLMKEKGTYLVPTLSAGTFILKASEEMKKKIKPEVLEKWEKVSAEMVSSHKLAYKTGVKIAFGTDLPVSDPHGYAAIELELMHKNLNMSAEEVILCATIESARAIRMDEQIGSIEEGKLADCLLLEKNPLEDITVFQNRELILKVIKNGEIVAEKGKLVSKNLFE